ncbi:hypothetical protein CLV93_1062 [Prolixibacter denitrificans]|uniref:Uncharacterized protein n=1 Tax=Prolixibacter denitrificans TaxID=1541063 RepID=A0A2P8CB99_9BACT|nr:hypothetical protein CLV93_1062 [Prolixibacter denitrificans]
MPKILMNGPISSMNGRIWYANENYDNRKKGLDEGPRSYF